MSLTTHKYTESDWKKQVY